MVITQFLYRNSYKFIQGRFSQIMAENYAVKILTQRLERAEKQLKLLTCEVNDIKQQLASVQQNPLAGTVSVRDFCTSTKRKPSETDSLVASKRTCTEFVTENDYVVVFTDGACENNGRPNARAGIGVWFGPNHPLNVSEPVSGKATNNVGEIQACISAVKLAHANGVTKLKIKTDSQFVINSMTQWIHRWKKNNWKVASGGAVKNKEDFVVLDNACKLLSKEHVEGHKGIVGNEEADRLAREGALRYKSS